MAITSEVDLARALTTFTIVGPFTVAEVSAALDGFYAGTPTKNVLWDLREAILPDAPAEDVRQTIRTVHDRAEVRAGGKTALVMSDAAGYAAALVARGIAEMELMPITLETFVAKSLAEQWLCDTAPAETHHD